MPTAMQGLREPVQAQPLGTQRKQPFAPTSKMPTSTHPLWLMKQCSQVRRQEADADTLEACPPEFRTKSQGPAVLPSQHSPAPRQAPREADGPAFPTHLSPGLRRSGPRKMWVLTRRQMPPGLH